MPRQSPVPETVDREFFAAANRGRLVVQYCGRCDRWQYPPTTRCPVCDGAESFLWREVEGRGTVYSFAVVHDTQIASLRADLPYTVVVVSLDECPGVLMLSHLPGAADVAIGQAVRPRFAVTEATGQRVPEWEPLS
ncbi:Zn-ribbon domain-containing OB-fold protein [Streptomyces gilvus]|uniref:Zn-ribbon domain-containing OB-fold protein n=1 Tax=Streptomyces gilvus TaxID=2920937 RepID=UPI001F0E4DA1|nr:OB-fold domain-containing protein [Streptomyces sp. CME 23]MCH5677587.1 OB-fold domain-containing protein [Streptomyces sp. CME 23]